MPKLKKKNLGDAGIRLKPKENNLLDNFNGLKRKRKKTKNKKRRKKKKKNTIKSVEIHKNQDPFLNILEDNKPDNKSKPKKDKKNKSPLKSDKKDDNKYDNKDDNKSEESKIKKVKIEHGQPDLTEKDPGIKSLTITASTKPDKNKEGHSIKLE